MQILVDNGGLVDLEAPIWMTEEQKTRFIAFFRRLFPDVKIVEGIEEKTKVMGSDRKPRRWTPEEYKSLFGPESNDELGVMLKRKTMSVLMMRGSFVATFTIWAKRKGHKEFPPSVGIIEEFLGERGEPV